MVDRLRTDALAGRDDRRERHEPVTWRLHVEHRERRGIQLVLRRDLHDDLIFVVWREDLRDLARAVGRRQRELHLIDGQAERCDLLPVERHGQLRILDLEVRIDVKQPGHVAKRDLEPRRHAILLGVRILQLVTDTGRATSSRRSGSRAGSTGPRAHPAPARLWPQFLYDLVRRQLAILAGLQVHVQPSAAESADVRGERGDVLVGLEDGHDFSLVRHHRLEADALHRLDWPFSWPVSTLGMKPVGTT